MKTTKFSFKLFSNALVLVLCLAILSFSISPLVNTLNDFSKNSQVEKAIYFDFEISKDSPSFLDNLLEEEAVLYFCYNPVNILTYDVKSIYQIGLASLVISREKDISILPPESI